MLERLYERPHALCRLRSGCTGPHIDGFAAELARLSYTKTAARGLIGGVAHLGQWLDERGIDLATLDEDLVAAFVSHIRDRALGAGKPRRCRAGGRRFLVWARECSVVNTVPVGKTPALILEFESWMACHRNLAFATLKNYGFPLRRLVEDLGEDPNVFDAVGVRQFVLAESSRAGRGYAKLVATAVRAFLRFLAVSMRCPPELVGAVPAVAQWRNGALPVYLSSDQVEQVIDACDDTTVSGRRDRAMVLLMARLGLRNGDLVHLRLADVCWENATIAVSGKGRRQVKMPLPQDVGDAMIRWLTDGRPRCTDDHVFVRLRAPLGPVTNVAVNGVVRNAASRAGLDGRVGPRVLRHSVATALVNADVSLPAIGALLRHASLDTTRVYAKVDQKLLASVARPWPVLS